MRNRFLMPALIFASFILSGMFVSNVMGESSIQSFKVKKGYSRPVVGGVRGGGELLPKFFTVFLFFQTPS